MKALIVNIPKGFWSDDWNHNFINVMPMGVFAIANYCSARDHQVLVSNTAVFRDRAAALETLVGRIEGTGAEVLGMPLHWHLCGYDVIRTAAFIKSLFPEIKIVLGGLTASVYPREIMESCASVDAVIRGDGEVPFCRYLDALEASPCDPDLHGVPNLFWRADGAIRDNGITYVANSHQLSELDFSPEGVMFSLAEYTNRMRIDDAVRGNSPSEQATRDKLFFMNVGRGCSYNCVYCSGGAAAHRQYCKRAGATVRSPASVLADFQRCYAAGFRRFHIAFDPAFAGKEAYYRELFASLRHSVGQDLHLVFEAYGLPSRGFLDAASRNFAWAGIILSPCFFGIEARKRYKGYSFGDDELEAKLAEILPYPNLQAFVYYGVTGLEEWQAEAIAARARYVRYLQQRYACEVSVLPIYAEPGSPWLASSANFGPRAFDLSYEDFFAEWQKPFVGWNDRLTGIQGTERLVQRIQAAIDSASSAPAELHVGPQGREAGS